MVEGDVAALRTLYQRYAGYTMAVALRVLRNEAEAEEVVQETFLEAWRRAPEFDERRGDGRRWLVTICRSRSIDRLRSRASAARVENDAYEEPAAERTPLEEVEALRGRTEVRQALDGLPSEQRQAIELAYWSGLTRQEIAARLGEPVGTIKSRIHLAMGKLASLLGRGGGVVSAPLTCLACQELLGEYALGILDDEDVKQVRAHLLAPAHEGCLERLAQAEAAAARLSDQLVPVRPRADLWTRIEAETKRQDPASPAKSTGAGPWRLVAALLAVAVVALLFFAWSGRTKLQSSEQEVLAQAARLHDSEARVAQASVAMHDCTEDLSRLKLSQKLERDAVALVEHPGTKVMALQAKLPDSPQATAIVNLGEKRALVLLEKINVPTAHDYELWVIRGDQKKAAGLLRPTSDGALAVELDPKLLVDGVDALAVTLEPAGGEIVAARTDRAGCGPAQDVGQS